MTARHRPVGADLPSAVLPLPEAERAAAIAAALSRTEDYDLRLPVVAHVERQAAARPDHPAVEDATGAVGYARLADQARRVAADLERAGVAAGDIVAVGGERGADVVRAFLALELLGAVYLPVDAAWPPARVEGVLADSAAVLLLTTGAAGAWTALAKGAAAAGCPTRPVTADGAEAFAGPARLDGPEQLRYLLYTSGSTGRPKGALVEHQGMLNHLWAKVQDLGLGPADRLAQTAPLGFDISVWQLLAPLLVGGTVQVFGDEEAQEGARLLAVAAARGTTVLEIVPTLIRFLLDAVDTAGTLDAADSLDAADPGGERPGPGPLARLRWLIATGEELPLALARRWLAAFPGIGLLNAYGPTECSDDVTHAVLTAPGPEVRHLPIGGPIGNVTLYVLRRTEDGYAACPPGEPGELFVGGVAVGRGYLDDPERTARAFFADPFTGRGRLYRTGDAVRRLPSAELEYLGRIDRQVKLGGVRMELAEIEAVLGSHPAVGACAVTLVEPVEAEALVARASSAAPPAPAPPRLVAYLAPTGPDWSREELRAHLAALLPRPMVPQTYVELAELPLTRNGKIDYAALPAPPSRDRPAGRELVAPAGPAEAAVAGLVAELLGLDAVGRSDAFLELGGDSLLAMRLVARLRESGSPASLHDVLRDGSPAALAALATSAASAASATTPPGEHPPTEHPVTERPATDGSGRRSRPLTPEQAGIYFHWRLDPDSPYYSYQGTLELDGPLDLDRLARAWELLLAENPLLLARFTEDEADGEPVHTYPHWRIPLPAPEDLTALDPADRERAYREHAAAEAARPFDLAGAPALWLRSFVVGPDRHRLLVTMHEILLDGWGATVLFDRLAELYARAADPDAGPDPARATRYDRYLDWHRTHLDSAEVARAGAYWRERLAGEPPVLDLGTGPRPTRPSYRGRQLETALEPHATAAVRATAQRLRSTPFVLLLAAYALALTYYGDAEEVVVGAPMANRERPEQIDVPAFMLAMLPLRIAIDPDRTLGDFTTAVHRVVMDGYAAADHPFGWTLRDLPAAARSGSATPVFQTMLNMPAYPARSSVADEVSFRFVELETGFTKYDCALYVQPHGPHQLLVQLAYQEQLLDVEAAGRVLASTVVALRALVEAPGTAIRHLDLRPTALDRAWPSTGEENPC
ncbi:amino acid adenylation domain-containing protein [Kitasatospora sp. NPDC093806]|uniref:amino acid adenylation domain-containing protein n=1 Tax=Kitasatospora sp. NPDC093806 TaxID=3155075 RepID=UPI00341E3BE5